MSTGVIDLEKALLAGVVQSLAGLPLAQENASFEKPAGGAPWASASLGYDRPRAVGGPGGDDYHSGLITLGLHYPILAGDVDAHAKAVEVVAFFRPGRVLAFAETRVIVSVGRLGGGGEVDGYYRRAVTVSWVARVARKS